MAARAIAIGADGPVDGVLQINDGCLYADVGSEGPNLLVFPFGTTWDASTSTAIVPSGRSVSVGQAFFGTGEDHEIRNLTPWFLSGDELARATSCEMATGITRAYVLGYVEARH